VNNYPGEKVENWKELTIAALIAQAVGAAWLYLRSIGNKVDKGAHEKAIAEIKAELDETNRELKQFARQAQVDEVKSDIRRLETKIEAKLDNIQQQLLTLLARDHK
jgi:hypothetical protein